jgi:hypothetical protein
MFSPERGSGQRAMSPAVADKWGWTVERIERLRQLAHCGADVDTLLNDPLLSATTPQSVRNMCTRLGLKLRQGTSPHNLQLRLTPAQWAELERMASARGVAAGVLAQRLVGVAIDDGLVDAIIDDDDARPEPVNSQLEREANNNARDDGGGRR